MHTRTRLALAFASLLASAAAALAESPQFRGPDRAGIYAGDALMSSWPEAGPEMKWSVGGLGQGYASLSVADGRIFTTGSKAQVSSVHAFALDGRHLWSTEYGPTAAGDGYPGTRTTPTYDDGLVYVMSSGGRAVALDAERGRIVWQRDLPHRSLGWGISESPLVVDDLVIVTPGGRRATLVGLDKKTGEIRWKLKKPSEASAYCSARLFEHGHLRQVITLTEEHLIGVDPATGELRWKHEYPGRHGIHAVSPVFHERLVYVSDGYGQGGKVFELAEDGRSVALRWEEEDLDVHHGGAVAVDGRIYGAASNGAWMALDAATGAVVAEQRRLGKGSVVYADGRLYGYTERGQMLLADPATLEVLGRFDVPNGTGQHWSHPVIADGVLYVRHGDALMAFDIAAR